MRELLKAGRWKEADKETYERMLQCIGKSKWSGVYGEDLLSFPCADLTTIDQLWVQSSKGVYGFSVQKEIYVNCGAIIRKPKQYPADNFSVWDRFGVQVSWRMNDKWLSWDNLYWDVPESYYIRGHLPWGVGVQVWDWGLVKEFFSLIETCRLVNQPRPKLDAVLLNSEKGIDYTRLRDLLKAGRWKEADQETQERMLQVTNRSQEGWFRPQDLRNFPCADLKTIDQLWVQGSQGSYGFSIQKEIYIGSGAMLEDFRVKDFRSDIVLKKFRDQIGWNRNSVNLFVDLGFGFSEANTPFGWVVGGQLFKLESSGSDFVGCRFVEGVIGHLPFKWYQDSRYRDVFQENFPVLALRLVDCNI